MLLHLFRDTILYGVSLFLFFNTQLLATNITYTNFTENIYKNNRLYLTIKAHKKVENIKKDAKTLFFNRKKYIADNFYYKDGSVNTKEYKIHFKRMFIYAQNMYMTQTHGVFGQYSFRAKRVTVYKNRIEFLNLFFQSKDKKGSRLKFVYYFDKRNKID